MSEVRVYYSRDLYCHADSLAEAVDLVRYGDPWQSVEPTHPDARDDLRFDVDGRCLTWEHALAEVEGEFAHDAGDVCHVCGDLVTWTDHLPPLKAGDPVRCFANVHHLRLHLVRA